VAYRLWPVSGKRAFHSESDSDIIDHVKIIDGIGTSQQLSEWQHVSVCKLHNGEDRCRVRRAQLPRLWAKMTLLSCHRFRSNEVRLWLSVIAYNLGNLWRRLILPQRIGHWSLTSLQQRLVKTGGRLIKHARYYWLLLAEGHLTRRFFGATLCKIAALPLLNEQRTRRDSESSAQKPSRAEKCQR
jgi:hypothetical protein